jgi:hypothetical protein
MRRGDILKEVLYTAVVALMIIGVWVFAYSRSMSAQLGKRWWPPKDPVLARRVLEEAPDTGDDAKAPARDVQQRVAGPSTSVSVVDVSDGD